MKLMAATGKIYQGGGQRLQKWRIISRASTMRMLAAAIRLSICVRYILAAGFLLQVSPLRLPVHVHDPKIFRRLYLNPLQAFKGLENCHHQYRIYLRVTTQPPLHVCALPTSFKDPGRCRRQKLTSLHVTHHCPPANTLLRSASSRASTVLPRFLRSLTCL